MEIAKAAILSTQIQVEIRKQHCKLIKHTAWNKVAKPLTKLQLQIHQQYKYRSIEQFINQVFINNQKQLQTNNTSLNTSLNHQA